ncbi:MAG: bifunctional glycosyltransferase family 2/GtrA family protein [Lentisphaeria bacterium]|nr:bifunctional glycosyltransferase family 2/GtrA family protein [Lentisphaeria bacterium]
MAVTLSLIIPCYNEEKTLHEIVERVLKIQKDDLKLELVIVDDCSTDNSYQKAQELCKLYPEIKLAHHEVNQGKGAALRTGFLEATGDYVGIQDADMEYDPEDYYTLLEPMLDGRADVVYGSRYLRPGTRRVLYFWHTWMNKTLTTCSNMFTNLDITDMETCYKLFRREIIQKIAPKLKENRFGFEPEVTAYVAEEKCRVYECAINYNPRTYDEGKKIGWKDGVRALYCILHYGACNAPVPMQLLLYFFIGGTAALVNLICFAVMTSYSMTLLPAVIGSYVISAVVNYILCILLLFRHKACWSTFGEFMAYTITLVIMGGIDYGITVGLIHIGIGMIFAKFLASIVGFFGNYLLRKYFVFFLKNKKAE